MNIITLDFETFWDSKEYTLSKMGPIEYIRDPRFAAQLLGVRINKSPVQVYEPAEIPFVLAKLELHKDDRIVVGHNLNGFDALILSEIYNVKPRWMFDTMAAMRWTGLARVTAESHSALTAYLKTGFKRDGTATSNGKHWPHDFTPAEREDFKRYCAEDVLQCSENIFKMIDFCTADSVRFSNLTARMATEPALWLLQGMLEQYITELDERAEKSRQEISTLFHFQTKEQFLSAIRSADKFCSMLRFLGQEPPMKYSAAKTATAKAKLDAEFASLQQEGYQVLPAYFGNDPKQARINELAVILGDDENYAVMTPALAKSDLPFLDLQDHPDERVALLVQTRLAHNSSIQRSRAERFLTLAKTNKPMPVMLNVFKAHTSRFTAGNSEGATDGTQMQNLNKRDPNQLTLRRAIRAPQGCKVISVDSSQIEARILAYVACQNDLVQQFRDDEDPYSQLAEKIFNVPWENIKAGAKSGDKTLKTYRNVGKTGILSAGYQVGWRKFSDTLLRSGAKLDNDLDKHREMAHHAWNIYRMSNSNIVAFWERCMQVVKHMEQGGSGVFGGPTDNLFEYGMMPLPGGESVPSIRMPSGFIIRYPNLRVEMNDRGRPEYFYDRARGRNMVQTKIYGGSLCENLCQGIAFQLLMWQACRMDEQGVPLKGNNHDAWIAVQLEQYAQATLEIMMHWMSQVPSWLPDFPVACEGEIGDDYTVA